MPVVFGMYLWAFLLILVLGFGLLIGVVIVVYIGHAQTTNQKAVKGSMVCEFAMKSGNVQTVLLPVVNGAVEAPKGHDTKGLPGGVYYTRPKKQYSCLYPSRAWTSRIQVSTKKSYWAEGSPEPWDPFDTEPLLTANAMQIIKDEKFGQLLLAATSDMLERMEKLMKMVKINPQLLYLLIIINILVSVVALIMNFVG